MGNKYVCTFLFSLVCFVNCSIYKSVRHNSIDIEEGSQNLYYYRRKNKPMNGLYKVRYKFFGNYSIIEFKNGRYHGLEKHYLNGILVEENNFQFGFRHGERVLYENGEKKIVYNYFKGFPCGAKLTYENNSVDSSKTIIYNSDSLHMDIYVNSVDEMINDRHKTIYELINPCRIKTDKYLQQYFQKTDSTLLYTSIWYRVSDCFHRNKEWGYSGN